MSSTKIYLAVPGTGSGNTWTAGGVSVGADQSGIGGTVSTVSPPSSNLWALSVNFEEETNALILRSKIVSIYMTCNAKSSAASSLKFNVNTVSLNTFSTTTSYADYTSEDLFTMPTYPAGKIDTWTKFNAIYGAVKTTGGTYTYYADKTYLTVTYDLVRPNFFFFKQ